MRENPNDPASKNLLLPDIPTLVHSCLKAEKDRNLSDNSMKELRRYLNKFSAYCQSQGISSAEELTPSFLKAYADHRCMDDKPTLKKAVVWSLRKFGKYLALLQVVNKDPAQNLRHPKFHPCSELPEYLTKKELRRLLEYSALELVRYIHLNPVRAGVVKSLSELDRYRWTGHSVLVGCRRRTWQDRDEILSHFGLKKRESVRRYREFIEDGFNMGRREDLTGGGLRRSAGGWEGVLEGIGPVFRSIPAFSLASHQAR